MIEFEKRILSNGLTVIVHENQPSQMCAVNVLYKVGARDEDPDKTGFAHLFEHLMFGGSANAPDFDEPLQMAGGDNNAFTNSDITNFYDILPVHNLETALFLEADRMQALLLDHESLEVQRKVVLEEFSETCLNPPFGLTWHHLCGMAYESHPYRWPTIGLTPDHIALANLDDVKNFFTHWYGPNNAIISVSGGADTETVFRLVEKYFGGIEARTFGRKAYAQDPTQIAHREYHSDRAAPIDSLHLAWRGYDRLSPKYYAMDLLSDLFSGGRSARFFKNLVEKDRIFASVDAYISGTADPGLFVIEGKPNEGVSLEQAEATIWTEIRKIQENSPSQSELEKQVNRAESQIKFSEVSSLNMAMSLAYYEALGDADMINQEMERYHGVTAEETRELACELLTYDKCCALYYHKS